jgi:p-cumic aldehyde dehydrogenase
MTMTDSTLRLPEAGLVIGGARPQASDGAQIDVEDPADGQVFARVPAGTVEDIDRAVAAARVTLESPGWSKMRPLDRGKLIEKLALAIEDHAGELALFDSFDNGMPVPVASAFVQFAAENFRYMAGWPTKLTGTVNPISADGQSYHCYSQAVPVGVVGTIVPWNAPLASASMKVSAALAAGCTVVLKPSEVTPLAGLRLAELALEVGFPEGAINVVTGHGQVAGQALVDHPGVDKITFTGSTAVGKGIVRSAANDLKRVTLELGGKSPNIIFADADLEKAAMGTALAIFANGGQICCAGSRLYIEASVFDKVIALVAAAAKTLKVGHGRNPASVIGPLVSRKQQERVLGYIETGVADGGELVIGGKAVGDIGYFVAPTILINTRSDSRVLCDEIFGPVLVAEPFSDEREVMVRANNTPYGLGAFVWTSNLGRAHRIAGSFRAGSVWVNSCYLVDAAVPFGGFKQSGWGRELSEAGVRAFTETRTVTINLDV